LGIPAIIEDITERKRAEVDLHDVREALSRATRLTMMGELSASIAHEINQPLGAIIMNGNAGLTAYDTQRIKEMYLESDAAEVAGKKAVLGALALYLDFINLFMMLLQLFGQRRQN
jgi:uncharacterized protein